MLNRVCVQGRITHDLELKYTPSGRAVCSFTIGTDRDRRKEDGAYDTDWLRIVTWGQAAEFVVRHFFKGKPIEIDGRIQTRDYTDKNGNKRTATEIIAEKVHFAGGEKRDVGQSSQQPYSEPAEWTPTDEDVPFE